MTTADYLESLQGDLERTIEALNLEEGTNFTYIANMAENGDISRSGGSSTPVEKDINFYDYDGTLVNSYTKNEFLNLNEMPSNPSHESLTAQGWNWSLSDAKTYVTDNGRLNIGQMYTTASGLSEFDIELTTQTGLQVTLNMGGTKNWGDGTTDDLSTHTYSAVGKYTITCDGTNGAPSSGMFGQSGTLLGHIVTNIRLANVTSLGASVFESCSSLKTITIPNTVTSVSNSAFYYCYALKSIVIPNATTSIGNNGFANCYLLENILMPKSVTSLGQTAFTYCTNVKTLTIPSGLSRLENSTFRNCYALTNVTIPSSVTYIGNYVFQADNCVMRYDFSGFSAIPTLNNANSLSSINNITKIIVPDSLYNSWKTTSNWSTYANYIYKASEV